MHALRLRNYRNSRVGNVRPATGTIELDNGGSGYRNSRSANRRPVTGTIDTAKFSFEGCEISSSAIAQLLFSFFSTISSYPQELSFTTNTISTADYIRFQSPMTLAGCESALLNKTLKFDYCSAELCSSLLSLKPLSLHEIYLSLPCNSA